MVDLLLYILIGVAAVQSIASQRLVGAKPPTGPPGAIVFTMLCRMAIIAGWVWFAFLTGYWQIAVMVLGLVVINYAGILAKKAAA